MNSSEAFDYGQAAKYKIDIRKVRRDFETVLRAMQESSDRQKTLAQHGILMSDQRLPVEVLDWRQRTLLQGRVLGREMRLWDSAKRKETREDFMFASVWRALPKSPLSEMPDQRTGQVSRNSA